MQTKIFILDKENPSSIIKEDEVERVESASSTLIQLFSGEEGTKIEQTLAYLSKIFPKAIIITASTDGEIANEKVLTNSTVVAISTFEHTTLQIAYQDKSESFETGKALAQELCGPDTKLLIAFANGLLCNGEDFLNGIASVSPEVIVSGGLSGDNSRFQRCFVGINGELYESGAVAVALNSKHLHVENFYSFGWQTIGVEHTITKSEKNRVYTIDNISAVAFYRKYLGKEIAQHLPNTGIEFPLIRKIGTLRQARAITAIHNDGSLSFAGNLPEGSKVYLGIGKAKTVLSNPLKRLENFHVESFFIYSCMARRRFLPLRIHEEMEPFAELAPTGGFFTYGEFFTDASPKLLNQTLTAVALSESDTVVQKPMLHERSKETTQDRTFKAMRHILEVTSKELHKQTSLQYSIFQELNIKTETLEAIQEMANLGSWELNLTTKSIEWSNMIYKILDRDPKDATLTSKELFRMVLKEERKKLLKVARSLYDGKIHSLEVTMRRHDGKKLHIKTSAKIIFHDNKAIKIIGTMLDLTEVKTQNRLLEQQSKAAQMGEMVSMIAHQWRQPLNAVSASAINLNMRNEMGTLTQEEIRHTAEFIEEMMQKMSQIINDFMNFTKPTNTKEQIIFHDILKDVLSIIGPQLTNRGIILTTDIEEPTTLCSYKKEIEHILLNLIANARDAFENKKMQEKSIHITTKVKANLFIIKVADNAGGIEESVRERVFDPYFTTKEATKGTGLGLYMSKKILKEHLNGDIFVQNIDGGAEFSVVLEMLHE